MSICDFRQADKMCLYEGPEKHTCALTSGTFMCRSVVLMSKTSAWVCEKAACHCEAPSAAATLNVNPHTLKLYINTTHMLAHEKT